MSRKRGLSLNLKKWKQSFWVKEKNKAKRYSANEKSNNKMHAWGCASPCIIFVLFLLWIGWSESAAPSFGCIGAGGTNVDFWFVYKFPRSAEYMYFDNSSIDWV